MKAYTYYYSTFDKMEISVKTMLGNVFDKNSIIFSGFDKIKKIRMNVAKIAALVLILFLTSFSLDFEVLAEDNSDDTIIYTVLTRSNLREAPSGSGNWISTVPNGALVVPIEEEVDGYVLILYGDFKGYIYSGCISQTNKALSDYVAQFPGLDETKLKKELGSGKTHGADIKYAPTEAQKYIKQDNSDKAIVEEANVEEAAVSVPGEESVKDELLKEEAKKIELNNDIANSNLDEKNIDKTVLEEALEIKEDIHETEYIQSATRDTKTITSPDAKVYNEENAELGDLSMLSSKGVNIVLSSYGNNGEEKKKTVKANASTAFHMRSLPTSESKKLSQVPAGAVVTVIDDGENGFVHIKYDGQEGYAFSRCLDYEAGKAYVGDSIETKTEESNAASGQLILSSRKALSKGAVSSLVEAENIEAMDAENIEKTEKVVVASAASTTDKKMKENVSKEISARVNMRALPTSDSAKVLSLPIGADIEILGQSTGGYSLVQYNGVTGYVLEDWIVDSVEVVKLGTDALIFDCTAYCSCRRCCGNYSPEVTGREPHTATGTIPAEGRTIAVDPSVIPYGTSVYIEGMGTYIAEDCGGGVKGNHIDIYFESHERAVQFGRRRMNVSIQR